MKAVVIALCGLALIGCFDGMGNQRADQQGHTVVGQVKARALDEKCITNLRSIRQSFEIYRTNGEDGFPASLSQLSLPADMIICPNDKNPYEYDPATGVVKCNHPGHKKY